jgi:hypothetical protein
MQTGRPKGETMNRTRTLDGLPKELDYRENDGLEVWLLWDDVDDRLSVLVVDMRDDHTFEVTVAAERALDAFHHPYAYAAASGSSTRTTRRRAAVAS